MKKTIYAILVVLFVLLIGYAIPKLFINEPFGVRDMTYGYEIQSNGQTKKVYSCGGSEVDPDILVASHLDKPIQRLLTVKLIFTKEDLARNKHIYKAYTLFAIPITTVELDCMKGSIGTTGGI